MRAKPGKGNMIVRQAVMLYTSDLTSDARSMVHFPSKPNCMSQPQKYLTKHKFLT